MPALLIADDHPLFRAALKQAAADAVGDMTIYEADSLEAVMATLERMPDMDLILLDLHMPGNHGLTGLAAIRAQYPAVAVMVCSANDDPRVVRRALDHGAAGFLPKVSGLDDLHDAIRSVLACERWLPPGMRAAVQRAASSPDDRALASRLAALSPQQFRVLQLVAEGLLNKQIADRLDIQERTVKAHVTAILERLNARNRTHAGVILRELELGDPSRNLPGS